MSGYLEKSFDFLGKKQTYFDLKKFETTKVLHQSLQLEQKIVKSKEEKLFLYQSVTFFDFQKGNEQIEEWFVWIQDENDIETLRLEFPHPHAPYVHIGPGFIRVQNY